MPLQSTTSAFMMMQSSVSESGRFVAWPMPSRMTLPVAVEKVRMCRTTLHPHITVQGSHRSSILCARNGAKEEATRRTSAKLALVAVRRQVPLDLDPQVRVGKPDPVPDRRAIHARVALAAELVRRNLRGVGRRDGARLGRVREAALDEAREGLRGEREVGKVRVEGSVEDRVAACGADAPDQSAPISRARLR